MDRAYSAADIRTAEAPHLERGEPLMARAARGLELAVVRVLRERHAPAAPRRSAEAHKPHGLAGSRVLALIGSGNNGGDGLFALAGLARRGVACRALLASDAPHAEGLAAARVAGTHVTELAQLRGDHLANQVKEDVARCDVVIDALTGTGVTGALRGTIAAVAQAARATIEALPVGPIVVAVDVPSGIGVDDGALPGPVIPADVTITMGAYKGGLLLPPARDVAGDVQLVEIGLDLARFTPVAQRLRAADVADVWPVPQAHDHKYTRGVLGVLAGSDRYPGAAVLACSAAAPLVGMVRYVGPAEASSHVLAARPEVVLGEGRVQAWALGSGIGTDDAERLTQVRRVLDSALGSVPVVADAGALAALPERVPPSCVLTPHAGELAWLLSAWGHSTAREEVEADPVGSLRRAVEFTGATVLLKGATTLVAGPGTPVYAQHDATGWLATAGAGDVLAGLLAGLLAGRSDDAVAHPALVARLAAAAALVHGRAARLASGGGPVRAGDVAGAVPAVLAQLLGGCHAGRG